MQSFPIPSFSKKHFPTDFKVTQVKSRKQDLSEETPEESVVATGSNFDILMPVVAFGTTARVFFLTSLTPSQYCKSWSKPWFDSPLGTFFLNLGLDLERA